MLAAEYKAVLCDEMSDSRHHHHGHTVFPAHQGPRRASTHMASQPSDNPKTQRQQTLRAASILQMGKTRPSGRNGPVQGHKTGRWQSQDSNPKATDFKGSSQPLRHSANPLLSHHLPWGGSEGSPSPLPTVAGYLPPGPPNRYPLTNRVCRAFP